MSIPFNKPFIAGKELFYISQAVLDGHLAGDGDFTKKCCRWMEERFNVRKAVLTHSCTAALEMSAIMAEVGPGDEVIMPSYTFVSTANAFALRGAHIRFVDIREDTLNLDEKLVAGAIDERTKVIVPVHYAGIGCEMDAIMSLANEHGLLVIEDAAQGVDATYKGRDLGTVGHLGAFSFHETKNVISGEGGALLVNDERFIERAEIIRDKGTNRSKFLRGQVDKYTWVDVGSSYLPSEVVAAFLWGQMEAADDILEVRTRIFDTYHTAFEELETAGKVRRPVWPPECVGNGHMYYLILNSNGERDAFIEYLRARDILSVFHYIPLHSSAMGRKLGFDGVSLPVTDDLAGRLVRLPCYFDLTSEDQTRVIDVTFAYFSGR